MNSSMKYKNILNKFCIETKTETKTEIELNNSDRIITVFDDPINYNCIHPLSEKWKLWYDCPNKKITNNNWIENIKEIGTLSSLEDFWGIYNNIIKTSSLSYGSNYYLFKDGIKPMWEDPSNKNGGKWSIQFKKNINIDLDNIWLIIMLHSLGNIFCDDTNNYNTEITGLIINIRKYQDKINIWLQNKNNTITINYIGNIIKNIIKEYCPIQNTDDIVILYQDHA